MSNSKAYIAACEDPTMLYSPQKEMCLPVPSIKQSFMWL